MGGTTGLIFAMDRKYIRHSFDRVHEVAEKILQTVMAANRQEAAQEAQKVSNYEGDTELELDNGVTVSLPSTTIICDGVYCVRSLGTRNYCRSSTAFWCVYSEAGYPLFVYQCIPIFVDDMVNILTTVLLFSFVNLHHSPSDVCLIILAERGHIHSYEVYSHRCCSHEVRKVDWMDKFYEQVGSIANAHAVSCNKSLVKATGTWI